jgi:hypothetical protein
MDAISMTGKKACQYRSPNVEQPNLLGTFSVSLKLYLRVVDRGPVGPVRAPWLQSLVIGHCHGSITEQLTILFLLYCPFFLLDVYTASDSFFGSNPPLLFPDTISQPSVLLLAILLIW